MDDHVVINLESSTMVETEKPAVNGWTPDARKLVKIWAGQTAINRKAHQISADQMATQSTRLKIVGAVFGSAATLISFLNTSFGGDVIVNIVLNVIAGVFAAVATLIGIVAALLNLDEEAEKNRQTAIQYANVCNEAQTILVEEDESKLPQATEFLRRMKDLTHLIQLFGPSLEEGDKVDLPSILLLRGISKTDGDANHDLPETADLAGIFDHDKADSNSPQERRKKRADMVRLIQQDARDIKRRQDELAAEENEIKEISKILSSPNVLSGVAPEVTQDNTPVSKPTSYSAPTLFGAKAKEEVVAVPSVAPSAVPSVAPSVSPSAVPSVSPSAIATSEKSPVSQDSKDSYEEDYTDDSENVKITPESSNGSPQRNESPLNRISRESLRNSIFNDNSNRRDNIAEPTDLQADIFSGGDNSRLARGVGKLGISPDILRAEIDRRKEQLRKEKEKLKARVRNNDSMKAEYNEERRKAIARRASTGNKTPPLERTPTRPIERSPRTAEKHPENVPSKRSDVLVRIKEALTPSPKVSMPIEEQVNQLQREKIEALQRVCGDDMTF